MYSVPRYFVYIVQLKKAFLCLRQRGVRSVYKRMTSHSVYSQTCRTLHHVSPLQIQVCHWTNRSHLMWTSHLQNWMPHHHHEPSRGDGRLSIYRMHVMSQWNLARSVQMQQHLQREPIPGSRSMQHAKVNRTRQQQ